MSDLTKEMGFRGDVARLLASDEKMIRLDNPNRECAAEAIWQMIDSAKNCIWIYCHRLANDIYDVNKVVAAMEAAYAKNPDMKVTLFVRDCQPCYNRFLDVLLKHNARIARNMTSRFAFCGNSKALRQIPDFFDIDNNNIRMEVSEKRRAAVIHRNNDVVSAQIAKYEGMLENVVRGHCCASV